MTNRSRHTETGVERTREVCLDLDFPPLPRGWERCLDLKSGLMYFKDLETGMQFNTDPHTQKHLSKSFETCKTPGDPSDTAKLDFKKSITIDSSSNHLLSRQLQHARSKTALPDRGLVKPLQQSLKRQKLLSKDEDDDLGLQLSLSVKNSSSYGDDCRLKSLQKSQAGDKPSKRQVELSLWSSIQSPRLERKCSKVGQSPTRASVACAVSSSVSRSSSSASSISVGFEGNETGDLREVESNKRKCSGTSNVKDRRSGEPTEMMAAGCAHCLMFVLLYRNNPKCPKCGSSILLDLPVAGAKFVKRNIDK